MGHLVQWASCQAGIGVAVIMSEVGDAPPREARMRGLAGIPFEMWLVCHRELQTSRHTRIVSDHLAASLCPLHGRPVVVALSPS